MFFFYGTLVFFCLRVLWQIKKEKFDDIISCGDRSESYVSGDKHDDSKVRLILVLGNTQR